MGQLKMENEIEQCSEEIKDSIEASKASEALLEIQPALMVESYKNDKVISSLLSVTQNLMNQIGMKNLHLSNESINNHTSASRKYYGSRISISKENIASGVLGFIVNIFKKIGELISKFINWIFNIKDNSGGNSDEKEKKRNESVEKAQEKSEEAIKEFKEKIEKDNKHMKDLQDKIDAHMKETTELNNRLSSFGNSLTLHHYDSLLIETMNKGELSLEEYFTNNKYANPVKDYYERRLNDVDVMIGYLQQINDISGHVNKENLEQMGNLRGKARTNQLFDDSNAIDKLFANMRKITNSEFEKYKIEIVDHDDVYYVYDKKISKHQIHGEKELDTINIPFNSINLKVAHSEIKEIKIAEDTPEIAMDTEGKEVNDRSRWNKNIHELNLYLNSKFNELTEKLEKLKPIKEIFEKMVSDFDEMISKEDTMKDFHDENWVAYDLFLVYRNMIHHMAMGCVDIVKAMHLIMLTQTRHSSFLAGATVYLNLKDDLMDKMYMKELADMAKAKASTNTNNSTDPNFIEI